MLFHRIRHCLHRYTILQQMISPSNEDDDSHTNYRPY